MRTLSLFDNDLNPSQTRNLERALNIKVIDRSELILDIFASKAQTHEARLAVELAQLEYSLPRLKRMWTHLSRQSMGVGMRGPGEKQLEVDRRLAEKRVQDLKAELEKVEKAQGSRSSFARRYIYRLLGRLYQCGQKYAVECTYQCLTSKQVDRLFATLDTRTRKWMLPGWGPNFVERYGWVHSRLATPTHRQFSRHTRRDTPCRPIAACSGCQQSCSVAADLSGVQGAA